MKSGFKKYLSCIVLILLCLVCAMVFYVSASELWGNDSDSDTNTDSNTDIESSIDSSTDTNGESNTDTEDDSSSDTDLDTESDEELPQIASIDSQGTILSEYLCNTNLRCEWAVLKNEGENIIYLSIELYLDTKDTITTSQGGTLIVNGEEKAFPSVTAVGTSTLLTTYTTTIEAEGEATIDISAKLNININEASGVFLSELTLEGEVLASEKYMKMEGSHLLELEHISQYPELPSGDEITSLAMVLAYLNYNVDKCELCDLYLEKGPVGYTDFNEANVGNPRNAYNSYGCLPPVIIDSATKFISVNGGSHKAYNYSGKNVESLYYEVSQDNAVIVWACENFDITPSISRIWVIDGKNLYLKSNMACMVLVGYDYENNTVTLANPAGNVFEIDMDLFEQRYHEMGSYSVVVK
ncbi:MAG: C39 family peptidase [Clostridia bacterium]|nr:C39 family peptidase [Clostridia bacterium]